MLMDLMIAGPVIVFTLLGMRDGFVRKLVASLAIVAGLILGHFYMRDVGNLLVKYSHVNPVGAPMMGYYAVVLFLFFVQIVIYHFGTGNYKMGGIADKILGTAMGLSEGVLMMSALIYISLMSGPYSRDTIRDSQFYETVVNIAPQILDFTTNLGPETFEKMPGMPGSGKAKAKPAHRPAPPSGGR